MRDVNDGVEENLSGGGKAIKRFFFTNSYIDIFFVDLVVMDPNGQ